MDALLQAVTTQAVSFIVLTFIGWFIKVSFYDVRKRMSKTTSELKQLLANMDKATSERHEKLVEMINKLEKNHDKISSDVTSIKENIEANYIKKIDWQGYKNDVDKKFTFIETKINTNKKLDERIEILEKELKSKEDIEKNFIFEVNNLCKLIKDNLKEK